VKGFPPLVCPACREVLEADGAESAAERCTRCGTGFPLVHGVRTLMPEPASGTMEEWQKGIYDAYDTGSYAGWRLGRAPDLTLTYWSHCREIAALSPPPGGVVLDVGCLAGRRLLEIATAFDVSGIGVDLSTAAIAAARSVGHPRLRFHAAKADALPLPDRCVDVAIAMDVLEHTAAAAPIIVREVFRCLKPGGRFLAHVPVTDNAGSLDAWIAARRPDVWETRTADVGHDYGRMPSSADLRRWFEEAGFTQVRMRRFNAWHQNRFDYYSVHRVLNTLFFRWHLPMAIYHDVLIHFTRLWYRLDVPKLRRGIGGSVYVTGSVPA
jgi:SAM-dependent methyltransferase